MSLLKQLVWIGSSKEDLKELPIEVQDEVGYGLYQAQLGEFPDQAKPLKGLNGVYELISRFDKKTFRAVYALKLDEKVYVLHTFQKKSKTGISTPKPDMDLIKQRWKIAKTIAGEKLS